tara:strand:+ start:291 stop:542 length:252 start_codon:yes stop_codon:yes gene_type:complete
MKYEYVVSGLTMGIDDLYYNEEVAKPYINHMNQKIIDLDKRFDNQNLSILYNAHQERRPPESANILFQELDIVSVIVTPCLLS